MDLSCKLPLHGAVEWVNASSARGRMTLDYQRFLFTTHFASLYTKALSFQKPLLNETVIRRKAVTIPKTLAIPQNDCSSYFP